MQYTDYSLYLSTQQSFWRNYIILSQGYKNVILSQMGKEALRDAPIGNSLDLYVTDLTDLGLDILSGEKERALAHDIEYGKLASVVLQLTHTDNNVEVPITTKGKARILAETAYEFLDELNILPPIELIIEKVPTSKKDSTVREIAATFKTNEKICLPTPIIEKLQELKSQGKNSRSEFINSNLRLVIDLAAKHPTTGFLSLGDLIQEGNIGLIKAIDKFEWWREKKLSTSATRWINQAIQRNIENTGDNIRVPVDIHQAYLKVLKAIASYQQKEGRDPTIEEIATMLGQSPVQIAHVLKAITLSKPDSLDRPSITNDKNSDTIGGIIYEARRQTPEEIVVAKERQEIVRKAVARILGLLTPKQRKYLMLFHGLENDSDPKIEEDLALMMQVTQQAINRLGGRATRSFIVLVKKDPELLRLLNLLNEIEP